VLIFSSACFFLVAAASGSNQDRRINNASVFSYVSLLSSFRSMLAETPAPLSVKSPSMAGVITPSKVNQSGRSTVRIKQQQQQQQQQQQKQGKHQADPCESVLDTSTPSKVAVGHDFRCLALYCTYITHQTRLKLEFFICPLSRSQHQSLHSRFGVG
jgi:hypothetical protein